MIDWTKLTDKKLFDWCAYLSIFLFAAAFVAITLNRHWQYETAYYDFGIFDNALYAVSQGRAPIIDHLIPGVGGNLIFADHLHLSMFLLVVPFYMVFPFSETILVVQVAAVAISGLLIYLTAKKIIGNRLAALTVLWSYFLYAGLQNALYFDFHEITLFTLAAALLIYVVATGRKKWYFPVFIFALMFKETLFVWGLGWSIFLWLSKKDWRKQAIGSAIIAEAWYFVAIKWLIPYFKGGNYSYTLPAFESIGELVKYVVLPIKKWQSLGWSGLSFGGTMLLVPQLWPMIALHYLMRFASPEGTRWDLGLHYNAEIAPFWALGMMLALAKVKKWGKNWYLWLAMGTLGMALILYQWVTKGPLRLAYIPDFYRNTANFARVDKMLAQIPEESTVMAQTNLSTHLTQRKKVWFLRDDYSDYQPDCIVVDWREGQNQNYFLGITDVADLRAKIATDEAYLLQDKSDELELYRRRGGGNFSENDKE